MENITYTKNDLIAEEIECINKLLTQLNPSIYAGEWEKIEAVMQNGTIFVARFFPEENNTQNKRGEVVGIASLIHARKPTAFFGLVEDVVVDESMRGKGIGKKLMHEIISHAKDLGMKHIELTSRPHREAANKLYQTLGFELRETNPYRMKLS